MKRYKIFYVVIYLKLKKQKRSDPLCGVKGNADSQN